MNASKGIYAHMDHAMHHGGMDHGSMDHGSMNHGSMNHGAMNHESMDHGSTDHNSMHQVSSSSNTCGDMNMHGHGMSVRIIKMSNNQFC